MPYPSPENPHYCPGSDLEALEHDPDLLWVRCPVDAGGCGRLISTKPDGRFFPHLDHPTRRNDAVQEGLTAAGLNSRRALRG